MTLDHTETEHFDAHSREVVKDIAQQMSEWLASIRQLADLDSLPNEF